MNKGRKEILTKISYMYYILDKTQNQISDELGINRSSVSRMIKQAKKEGIVSIQIQDLNEKRYNLEQYIKEKYQMRNIVIVPTPKATTEAEKEEMLAKEAGFQLKQLIHNDKIIGLTWGLTLGKAISYINAKKESRTVFLPLVGGPSHINSKYHVNTLVYELANKFGGDSIFVNSSVVQESKHTRDEIVNSKYFKELRDYWNKIDLAIVGIGGTLNVKDSKWRDLLTIEDYEDLRMRDAVGDCCCRFFASDGRPLRGNLNDRIVGISLEQLKKVPISVGVARSKQKAKAILAMLRAGYINVLITDEETAIAVLDQDKDSYYQNL